MPCGGISPMRSDFRDPRDRCFHCSGPGPDHFVEEWDASIHGSCVLDFLAGPEGQVVLNHGHEVLVRLDEGEGVVTLKVELVSMEEAEKSDEQVELEAQAMRDAQAGAELTAQEIAFETCEFCGSTDGFHGGACRTSEP